MREDRKERMSYQITTEACMDSKELNLEDRKSEVEHREVPKEDVVVKSVKGRKKRHRDRHLAAGRLGEPEGTDPRRLWIPEEVGCGLQEGVPSCSSSTAQEKRFQENSGPGKLWTAEGIGRSRQGDDPLCRSGTTQGTRVSGAQS
jgi:hypothetical protein